MQVEQNNAKAADGSASLTISFDTAELMIATLGPNDELLRILQDRKDGVKLSDFESALIGRIMVLRARGEFVIPETLLSALDDAVV